MSLSPEDIVSYRFKQALRGYAIEEVDELLDRLADQIEQLQAENTELRTQLDTAAEQSDRIHETESTIQRALVVAQQAADRNLAEANEQAQSLVAEATERAQAMVAEAEEHAALLRGQADADAANVRTEADAAARASIDNANALIHRELSAARARLSEANERHHGLLREVIANRDGLRAQLAGLDGLVDQLDLSPPAIELSLVAGELPDPRSYGYAASAPDTYDTPGDYDAPGSYGAPDEEAYAPEGETYAPEGEAYEADDSPYAPGDGPYAPDGDEGDGDPYAPDGGGYAAPEAAGGEPVVDVDPTVVEESVPGDRSREPWSG